MLRLVYIVDNINLAKWLIMFRRPKYSRSYKGHYPYPVETSHSSNIGSMLAQRLRRWPNIEPVLDG